MEKKKKKRESSPTATSSAPMAADWSQLPKELLQLISERLESELYLLRFRSVCSTWRSSIPSHRHRFPSKLPIPNTSNIDSNDTMTIGLSKRSLFLITPPPHQQQTLLRPWLIKMGPDSDGKTRLWHPFSEDTPITPHFHHVLDFNQLPILDLGHDFVLGDFSDLPTPYGYVNPEWVVAEMRQGKESFVLFAFQPPGELILLRCRDEQWTMIPDPDMEANNVDICIFKGQLCAVDDTGRTVTVQPDLSVNLVAEPVFGGEIKFLVKSGDELLLVDSYGNNGGGDALRIDVFRLDTREKKWVELTSLGDKVLFFAANRMFCASASDLCLAKGNCAIFSNMEDPFGSPNVLELGHKGFVPPLPNPDYSNLFWPPPDWVGLR